MTWGKRSTFVVVCALLCEPALLSGDEKTLRPAVHPAVPADLSLVWLVPATARPRDAATERLASGIAAFHAGRHADAAALGSLSGLDKSLVHYAFYYAARGQLKLGRVAAARRQFATIRAENPEGYLSHAAAIGQAEAAQAVGDHLAAYRIYERLLTSPAFEADNLLLRAGRAAVAAGEPTAGIAALRRLYFEFPLSPKASEALKELTRLRALEPVRRGNSRYRAELQRADRLFEGRRYSEARSGYDRVHQYAATADRSRIEVRRAACDFYMGKYVAARAALRAHTAKGSLQAEAMFYDAMAARGAGAHDEFARLAHGLIEHSPPTSRAEQMLDVLATFYIQRDQPDRADAAFRQLLARFPEGRFAERAAWKVGWRAYRRGDLHEAAGIFERAASAFPRSDYRPAYLYWSGRAREALGEQQAAASRYAIVRTDYRHSYYGQLADTVLASVSIDAPVRASIEPPVEAPGLPASAALIRALMSMRLYDDALTEIRFAQHVGDDGPALRATLGWLHHHKGQFLAGANVTKRAYPQYLTAAGATALPHEVWTTMFPLRYWTLIQEHARHHRLDPYVLAALIFQESTFVADIRSPAKATGLMQLMPATAERYARKLGITYSPGLLVRPEQNVRMGTAYLADLLAEFGELHLALASYNAGESHVRRWLAERPALSSDEFIDDIPFPETQNYVKKILGAAENYRRLYGENEPWTRAD